MFVSTVVQIVPKYEYEVWLPLRCVVSLVLLCSFKMKATRKKLPNNTPTHTHVQAYWTFYVCTHTHTQLFKGQWMAVRTLQITSPDTDVRNGIATTTCHLPHSTVRFSHSTTPRHTPERVPCKVPAVWRMYFINVLAFTFIFVINFIESQPQGVLVGYFVVAPIVSGIRTDGRLLEQLGARSHIHTQALTWYGLVSGALSIYCCFCCIRIY